MNLKLKSYLDNSATTKPCKKAIKKANYIMRHVYGNPSSTHEEGIKAKDELENARKRISECLNCSPEKIIFTSGGTESNNQVFNYIEKIGEQTGKKHIIASPFEHPSVRACLDRLSLKGFRITYLKVGKSGVINPENIKKVIRKSTLLCTVMYVNNEIGTIQPIKEIAKICDERGLLFHSDAVQAVGHLPVDLAELGVDFLSASAHKFGGLKGSGFLYCANKDEKMGLILGGGQENELRSGTENLIGICAMAEALEWSIKNLEKREAKILKNKTTILNNLLEIPDVACNGDPFKKVSGNINVTVKGVLSETLVSLLSEQGVYVSSGSACHSSSLSPSETLLAIGKTEEEALSSIRLSIGDNLNILQIKHIINTLKETIEYLRKFSN